MSVQPIRTPDGKVTVPEEVIHSMARNKIGLKGMGEAIYIEYCSSVTIMMCVCTSGPLETQIGKGAVSLNLTLRR